MATNQNYHIQYPGVTNQHWHSGSGRYAGGDHLLTALTDGWELQRCLKRDHTYDGMRAVTVYEFHLQRGEDQMVMPVINNPYIERFLYNEQVEVTAKQDEAA